MSKKKVVRSNSDIGSKVGYGKYKDKTLTWVAKNDIEFFKQIENLYLSNYHPRKKVLYRRLFDQYVNEVSPPKIEEYVQKVISFLKGKQTSEYIINHLKNLNLNHSTITSIMIDANNFIRKEFELEKNFLLDIHLLRYETIYIDNIDVNLDHISAGYRKAVLCEHKITALETLFQKEKLLGVHTKSFKLQLDKHSVVHKNANLDFDLSRLTASERLEIFQILEKAKPTEKYNKPITQNNNPLEVNQTTSILEEQEKAPISYSKETNRKKEEDEKQAIDQGLSLEEVKEKISNNLKEKVKELFNKKKKNDT
jgi:hypothetical protein